MSSSKISFLALLLAVVIGCSTPPQPLISTVSLATLPQSFSETTNTVSNPAALLTALPTSTSAATDVPPTRIPPTAKLTSTIKPFQVVKMFPKNHSKGITGIGRDNAIQVRFSNPMVPLSDLNHSTVITHPLTIEPNVPTQGYWSNVYTYVMFAEQDLNIATTYTVTVKPTKDLEGHALDKTYAWSFETVRPAVSATDPIARTQVRAVGVMEPVTVYFNTEVDRGSVESRLRVMREQDHWAALGTFKWGATSVTFTPRYPLDYDTDYILELAPGAQDVKLITALEDYSVRFKTFPHFALVSTTPYDYNKNSTYLAQEGLLLRFSQPAIGDKLQVSIVPPLTRQSYDQNLNRRIAESNILRISGDWKPSTAYTVTIGADTRSIFNERLEQATVIHFTTSALPAFMHINLPALGLYDASGPQNIFATYTNVSRINYELYHVPYEQLFKLLKYSPFQGSQNIQDYPNLPRDLVKTWSQPLDVRLNETRIVSTTLANAVLAKPPPGVYVLRATAPETKNVDKTLLLVSSVNLAVKYSNHQVLVWVTNLTSGKPVANQPINVYSSVGMLLAHGVSDAQGIFRAPFEWPKARKDRRLLVVSEDAQGKILAAAASDWQWGIAPSDYDLPTEAVSAKEQILANLYTDRAIYRAGQTVYFKGILRINAEPQPAVPSQGQPVSGNVNATQAQTAVTEVATTIYNSQGQEISKQTLPVNEFGSINGKVELNENAPTGDYRIETPYGMVYFTVDQYRKPEFEVHVTTDQPAYLNGDKIQLTVNSTYFFGGPVTGADVTWRVLTENYFAAPDIDGVWEFSDNTSDGERAGQDAGQLRNGTGKTDSSGTFTVTIPARLDESAYSQIFTIEAEIADTNHQSVANRITVPVHRGAFYLGMQPDSYVATVNARAILNLVAVKSNAAAGDSPFLPNQPITVSFYASNWFNVREFRNGVFEWRSTYSETLLAATTVLTNKGGRASTAFTPTHGGEFRVAAESIDTYGNHITSATHLYVSGQDYTSWRIENTNRIPLVSDKKSYKPGETATLLVLAPFADAEALVTIERGDILDVQRLHIQNNTATLHIPINADYAPNFFVSMMVVKGRSADSAIPQFKMGYVNLAVETVAQTLNVQLEARCSEPVSFDPNDSIPVTRPCQPNDTATLTLHATDYENHPARAEFSIAVVDKPLLTLVTDNSTPLLSTFYQARGLGVKTATSLLNSIERDNLAIRTGAKGGGGGGAEFLIRHDLRDTAYWNPTLVTDAHGDAQVQVKLPDNLTTWNVAVKGITTDTRVGQAQLDLLSTRPLLIRPVTPRFFVVGDKTTLEAVVNNNTDVPVTARITLTATGINVGEDASQTVTILSHDKTNVRWETTTDLTNQATLRFTATTDTLHDGIEIKLPVQIPQWTETLFSEEPVDTRLTKALDLHSATPGLASLDTLDIRLTPSIAAASRDALSYLESYPYECSEQTTSKFLPNIATYLAVKRLGIERPDLFSALQTNVSKEIQRLYYLQHDDGGWGLWRDSDSRAVTTSYALFALNIARAAGFAVDEKAMERAEKYLDGWLDKPIPTDQEYTYNERLFTLYVLTELGHETQGRLVASYEERANLDTYAKAFLLLALHKLNLPQQAQLLQELNQAATVDATYVHWTEKHIDTWNMNTETRTQAITILTLARLDPKNPLLPKAVKWLMDARKLEYQAVHWDTTQETAWGVMALAEWMAATGELEGNYSFQVALDGQFIGSGRVTPATVEETRSLRINIRDVLQNTANELLVTRDSTQGALYASAYLNKYIEPAAMPTLNHGVEITRQYYAVDPLTLKPTTNRVTAAKLNEYVQVKLTLRLSNNAQYFALEDPLPAGFEAVDSTLQTSSAAAASAELSSAPGSPSRPYWEYWGHTEIRDDRVALFADSIAGGTYEYIYIIRASVAGSFNTLPTRAYAMYNPLFLGQSAGSIFTITP